MQNQTLQTLDAVAGAVAIAITITTYFALLLV